MGVPTLYEMLKPARSAATLQQLADEAFRNSSCRGLRVGVDASLWLFQVKVFDPKLKAGEDVGANPDLRALMYRVWKFMSAGALLLVIFDGAEKPPFKRGNHVGGGWRGGSRLERDFKELLDLLGVRWRKARGEAEAELAVLAKNGELDVVLTDDVDALVFGAPIIMRNDSVTLSGNRDKEAPASEGRQQYDRDLILYRASDMERILNLKAADLILIALLSGGDYHPEGISGCGTKISVSLAQAGFATILNSAVSSPSPSAALSDWREAIARELETNSRGFLSSKHSSLARNLRLATSFPNLTTLKYYTNPAVNTTPVGWDNDNKYEEIDMPLFVQYCSKMFEWPHVEIRNHFKNKLWKGLLVRELRKGALLMDREVPPRVGLAGSARGLLGDHFQTVKAGSSSEREKEGAGRGKTSSKAKKMITTVVDAKLHNSTDGVESYRVELDDDYFFSLVNPFLPFPDPFKPAPAEEAAEEVEIDPETGGPKSPKKRKNNLKEPTGVSRHWVPKVVVEIDSGCKEVLESYKEKLEAKERKKDGKGKGKGKGKAKAGDSDDDEDVLDVPPASAPAPSTSKPKLKKPVAKSKSAPNVGTSTSKPTVSRKKKLISSSPPSTPPTSPPLIAQTQPPKQQNQSPSPPPKKVKPRPQTPIVISSSPPPTPPPRPVPVKPKPAPRRKAYVDDLTPDLPTLDDIKERMTNPKGKGKEVQKEILPKASTSTARKQIELSISPESSPLIVATVARDERRPTPVSPSKRRYQSSSVEREEARRRIRTEVDQEEKERWENVPQLVLD